MDRSIMCKWLKKWLAPSFSHRYTRKRFNDANTQQRSTLFQYSGRIQSKWLCTYDKEKIRILWHQNTLKRIGYRSSKNYKGGSLTSQYFSEFHDFLTVYFRENTAEILGILLVGKLTIGKFLCMYGFLL